jgi:hypothetical protein
MGFIGKVYDDLDELYEYKDPRVMEPLKTFWTLMIFYFMKDMAQNKYDILWMMFVWTFLPLVDWYAFTDDPYFLSLVIWISFLGAYFVYVKGDFSEFQWWHGALFFALCCVCAPATEFFMFELNGPIQYILKTLGLVTGDNSTVFSNVSKEELEVSSKKLVTRIISFIFLFCMVGILAYLKSTVESRELKDIFTGVMYLALTNNGYFLLSIINQAIMLSRGQGKDQPQKIEPPTLPL